MKRLVWGTRKPGYFFWDLRPPSEVLRSHLPADLRRDDAMVVERVENVWDIDFSMHFADPPRVGPEWIMLSLGFMNPADWPSPGSPSVVVGYHQQWCECPRCGYLDIAAEGSASHLKCKHLAHVPPKDSRIHDSPRLMKAYMAARQARFERRERAQVYELQSKLDRIREVLDSNDA